MGKYDNVEKFELDIYGKIPRKIQEAEDSINEALKEGVCIELKNKDDVMLLKEGVELRYIAIIDPFAKDDKYESTYVNLNKMLEKEEKND